MKTLLNILNIFFVTLGIIFFALLICLTYLFIADPFGLKPLLFPAANNAAATTTADLVSPTEAKTITISPAQAQALKSLNIDPTKVPTTISPEMQQCFIATLGSARTNEIINGAVPTALDYLKAKSCLK